MEKFINLLTWCIKHEKLVPKYICPWHIVMQAYDYKCISFLIKDLFVSYSVIFWSVLWPVVWQVGGSIPGHDKHYFPSSFLPVRNIPWFPGAQWGKRWHPTTVLSAASLGPSPPRPTWGPSTSVRMASPAPPRTFCRHPTRTHYPRTTARFTTAPRGKVSATALPILPPSFPFLTCK